jgi:hypothetical protein
VLFQLSYIPVRLLGVPVQRSGCTAVKHGSRLDRLAASAGTSRSELLRRGALAVLEAAEIAEADQRLVAAYRRQPQDPAIVEAVARLAAETAPEW